SQQPSPSPSITPNPSPAPDFTSANSDHVDGSVTDAGAPVTVIGRLPTARVHRLPSINAGSCRARYAATLHRDEQYCWGRPRPPTRTGAAHREHWPKLIPDPTTACNRNSALTCTNTHRSYSGNGTGRPAARADSFAHPANNSNECLNASG